MSKAEKFFHLIKKNSEKFETSLRKLFKARSLEIEEITPLKNKIVTKNQHKLTVFLKLKNCSIKKIILEIHDNQDYFKRNIFGLTELRKTVNVPLFFGKISSYAIAREYVEEKWLFELITKKQIPLQEIFKNIIKISKIAAAIHSIRIDSLPKFLFRRINKEIEIESYRRALKKFPPESKILENKIKNNLNKLLRSTEKLEKTPHISLIHGDFQVANFFLNKNIVKLTDFDTLEVGNPAKDLGNFCGHLGYLMAEHYYSSKAIKTARDLFLKTYFKKRELNLNSSFQTDINFYEAEGYHSIISAKLGGRTHLSLSAAREEIKKIEKILITQEKLLNI
jgi:thiamine kinase-like enzyme